MRDNSAFSEVRNLGFTADCIVTPAVRNDAHNLISLFNKRPKDSDYKGRCRLFKWPKAASRLTDIAVNYLSKGTKRKITLVSEMMNRKALAGTKLRIVYI